MRVDPRRPVAARAAEAGGELDDDVADLARTVSAEGRSRAYLGGRGGAGVGARRAGRRAASPCTASPTSSGCCSRRGSGTPSTGTRATPSRCRWRRTALAFDELRAVRRRAGRAHRARPRAGPGGRPAALRAGRDRGRSSRSRARTTRWRPRRSGWRTPTRCGPRPTARTRRWSATPTARDGADATALVGGRPARRWSSAGVARPRAGRAGGPAARARLPAGRPRRRPRVLRRGGRGRPGAAGRGAGAAGRGSPALIRKYADTRTRPPDGDRTRRRRAGLVGARRGPAGRRCDGDDDRIAALTARRDELAAELGRLAGS